MNNSIVMTKKSITVKSAILLISIAASVILPQLFHALGTISGTGAAVGTAFLPMHIPVLLAGFTGGPLVGLIAGILSPLVSFGISGMPAEAVLPFITIELGAYGLVSGLLSKSKINSFIKLIITQASGRIVRAVAILAAIFVFGNTNMSVTAINEFIISGLFGIILQWALIPLITERMEGIKKLYE